MTATAYHHIVIDERGVPWLADTRVKVIEIALDQLAYHWDAEEIHRQHPHLTLSSIHSALAYFYDHREQIEQEIAEQLHRVDRFFEAQGPCPIRAKLLAVNRGQLL